MIDVFTHILPPEYNRRLKQEFERSEDKELAEFFTAALAQDPGLSSLDKRLEDMEEYGPDYKQVLTLSAPALEEIVEPNVAAELARLANDEMADLVAAHPDRFVGFAAALPMNDTEAAVAELDYAVQERGALGTQIGSTIQGRAIDSPDVEPVLVRLAELDRALWIHPARSFRAADYVDEDRSKYFLFVSFGWPYDTTLAMARLVYSGLMERLPNLTVIGHHGGGMIPFFYARAANVTNISRVGGIEKAAAASPVDYFRRMYVDTVLEHNKAALAAVLDFFGPEHVLFGSDYGFNHDPRPEAKTVEALDLSPEDRELVFEGNARRILRLAND
jgi:aminocarboxymuconate-semialdehyde decarboxylase